MTATLDHLLIWIPFRNVISTPRHLTKTHLVQENIIQRQTFEHLTMDLPPLSTIPSLPQEAQLRVLDTLFEPSPELHQLMIPVLANQTFDSYGSLIEAVGGRMGALSAVNSPTDRDVLFGILGSHPRLGRAPTNPEHLSELSRKEQAQLNTGAEEQAEKLRALNAEYEARFPGLRFV